MKIKSILTLMITAALTVSVMSGCANESADVSKQTLSEKDKAANSKVENSAEIKQPEFVKVDEKQCTISGLEGIVYDGNIHKLGLNITYDKKTLKQNTDYDVVYSDELLYPGEYVADIRFKGGYDGEIKKNFTIDLETPEITDLSAGLDVLHVSYKNVDTLSGYEIEYSTNKDFSESDTQTVEDGITAMSSIEVDDDTDSEDEKTAAYYVRVRSFLTNEDIQEMKDRKKTENEEDADVDEENSDTDEEEISDTDEDTENDTSDSQKENVIYSEWSTPKNIKLLEKTETEGRTYIDGVIIANKTYNLPSDYDPGVNDDAAKAFELMAANAEKDGITLKIVSGYRSYDLQSRIYSSYVKERGQEETDKVSARPGHSEHQTGFAFDINSTDSSFIDTPEAEWLDENCYKYGFIIRYPDEKLDITGYSYEPWHIRYVGKDYAEKLYKLGLTLEEYFGISSQYEDDDYEVPDYEEELSDDDEDEDDDENSSEEEYEDEDDDENSSEEEYEDEDDEDDDYEDDYDDYDDDYYDEDDE